MHLPLYACLSLDASGVLSEFVVFFNYSIYIPICICYYYYFFFCFPAFSY